LTDKEARANFDINVFGSLNVIRQALPYMRNSNRVIFSTFHPLLATATAFEEVEL